jgi:iron complex outermembrane receptor protein
MVIKIVLQRTILLFICLASSQLIFGQAGNVSGKVTDENGNALPAAVVRAVDHPQIGAVTDESGSYTIKVTPEVKELTFSYVGFRDTTLPITGSTLNVRLQGMKSLNEVVVIGYGTQQKKDLTGAIATVSVKDFQKGSITTVDQLISGKVAGVSITSNGGSPGAGSVIRIRGGASLNASNDPLIVIDGLPLSGNNIYGSSNQLSLLNPNDIASITVLKDAAAAAIYGSRASNGVILITTKKGGSGKPAFNFSSTVSLSKLVREIPVMSAGQFRQYINSHADSAFKSLMGSASTDWQNEIFSSAVTTNNNLSVTGSLKDMPYRISGEYLHQNGILNTDQLQRETVGLVLSPRVLQHLKIDINLNGSFLQRKYANGSAVSSAVYFDPTQPVEDPSSPYGGYFEWASTDANTGAVTLNKLAPRNPVSMLNLYSNKSNVKRSFGNIRFDYALPFLPDLHANLNLGYDISEGEGHINVPAYAAQNYLDSGQDNQYRNQTRNEVSEFYLNYVKELKGINSNINATVGYGYYNNWSKNYNYPSFRANGDTIPGSKPVFPFDEPENTLLSYYARAIYTYQDRYILAASLRRDGSSKFAPENRWGTFPSIAFTWKVGQEGFLNSSNALSELNLRLSYGVTGNQDGIYDYPYQPVYSISDGTSKTLFGSTYYNMATPGAYDASLKWEQTASYNAGLDYGFLKGRIHGSVDFYYKKTKNLLNTIPIPAGSNFSSTLLTNVGNMDNKGVEFMIDATPVKNKHFSWDVSFNVSYNNNKITNLTATRDSTYPGTLTGNGVVQINSIGYSANAFYVYHQQYDKNGKPIEGVFEDVNGDGIINSNDLYRYQSPFPVMIYGFSTRLTYNRWTLNTVLRANTGNYLYDGVSTGAVESNILNPLGYLANVMSNVRTTHFYYSNPQSDYYVQNASFLKMDNIGLSYNAGRIFNGAVSLVINAHCQNVFTITNYTGIDPEIYGGIDNTIYPRPRTYTLGINLGF